MGQKACTLLELPEEIGVDYEHHWKQFKSAKQGMF